MKLRTSREVTQAAARHSPEAYAVRQLELSLLRTAWESLYVDYSMQRPRLKADKRIKLSALTQRLFKDSRNAGARRRRVMQGYSDAECEEGIKNHG